MANTVKYNDVNFPSGSPIAGERMATNGNYTGEHKGTPLQDAKVSGVQTAKSVEAGIVRYGTLMGDAIDTNFPTKVTNA
jgi:molybdenum cofactor biosynthesis enzyme